MTRLATSDGSANRRGLGPRRFFLLRLPAGARERKTHRAAANFLYGCGGKGRILMLRYSMRAVWSCRQMCPLVGGC